MIYLAIGCIIMKIMDKKYPNTLLIAWLLGAVVWLPAVCYGLLKGLLKKRG
jgi:hypothetical protein